MSSPISYPSMASTAAGQDDFPGGSRSGSVHRQAMDVSVSQAINLNLMTREGDSVTVSWASVTDLESLTYDRTGRLSGPKTQGEYRESYRSMTLSSGSRFDIAVSGDLSQAEREDIESILAGLDRIMGEMTGADMDTAVASALALGGYDTVSRFEADLSVSASVRTQTLVQSQSLADRVPFAKSAVLPMGDGNDTVVERMKSLFDKREARLLRALVSPVKQLFAQRMTPLEAARKTDDRGGEDFLNSLRALEKTIMAILEQAPGF